MFLIINDKNKIDIFSSIFQILKTWSQTINMTFNKSGMHIQIMDQSHICLANVELSCDWFSSYECITDMNISVNLVDFSSLMKYALKHNKLEIKCDEDDLDKLYVNFLIDTDTDKSKLKGNFNHFFELVLLDVDSVNLNIPKVDYDAEFIIETKVFISLLTELNTFCEELMICCNEEKIELNANGDNTKLKIDIPISDLEEYSINEGESLELLYSLKHLYTKCVSTELNKNMKIGLNNEMPMSILYDLGDKSNINFYISPKM